VSYVIILQTILVRIGSGHRAFKLPEVDNIANFVSTLSNVVSFLDFAVIVKPTFLSLSKYSAVIHFYRSMSPESVMREICTVYTLHYGCQEMLLGEPSGEMVPGEESPN